MFKRKSSGWVAIDIGASSIKMLSVQRSGKGFQLNGYTIVPLPPGAIVDGAIEDTGVVTEAIERGMRQCSLGNMPAIVAVPASAVIVKQLQISRRLNPIEFEDQVKIEAEQLIPYSLDEVSLDFVVQGPVEKDPDLNHVLLVVCRKDTTVIREDVVNSAGLNCQVVDVETYAFERLFNPLLDTDGKALPDDQLVALVNIGHTTLTLSVFQGDSIIYSRDQQFGGQDLYHSLRDNLGMDVADIDRQLRAGEMDPSLYEAWVLPFRESIAQQISLALEFFYSSGSQQHIQRLYLSGGLNAIEGLMEVVGREVEHDVVAANPFKRCKLGPRINAGTLNHDAPFLVKAYGLALSPLMGRK